MKWLKKTQAIKQHLPDEEEVRPDSGSSGDLLRCPLRKWLQVKRLQSIGCFHDFWMCAVLVKNANELLKRFRFLFCNAFRDDLL